MTSICLVPEEEPGEPLPVPCSSSSMVKASAALRPLLTSTAQAAAQLCASNTDVSSSA